MVSFASVFRVPRLGKRLRRGNNATRFDHYNDESPSETGHSQKRRTLESTSIYAGVQCPEAIEPSPHTHSDAVHDSYVPRQSKRLKKNHHIDGDGDTWIECLVVNIKDKKQKTTKSRSLFYSIESQRGKEKCAGSIHHDLVDAQSSMLIFLLEGNWDEPPSGASNIIYLGQGRGLEVVQKKKID